MVMAFATRTQPMTTCSASTGAASTAASSTIPSAAQRPLRRPWVQPRQLKASGHFSRASSLSRPAKASLIARRISSGSASASATRAEAPPQAAIAASASSGLAIATTRVPPISRQGTASSARQW
jgi:hypothetical protein